jgi:hypothetical protein
VRAQRIEFETSPCVVLRARFDARFELWLPRMAGWLRARVPDADEREQLLSDVFVRGAPLLVSPIAEEHVGRLLLHLAHDALARRR